MAAEHVRAAAIVGQRRDRVDRMILALAGAEVALQSPECRDHRRRHAVVLHLALEQRPVLLDLVGAAGEASARQHLVGHFEEGLREEASAAVDIDDALIEHEIGRRGGDRGRRNALASASRLKSASQRSKLPVLRQFGWAKAARRMPISSTASRAEPVVFVCFVISVGFPVRARRGRPEIAASSRVLLVEPQPAYAVRSVALERHVAQIGWIIQRVAAKTTNFRQHHDALDGAVNPGGDGTMRTHVG